MDIWRTQLACAQNCLRKAASRPPSQRHRRDEPARDDVVWDRTTGLPIAPAIVWQDRPYGSLLHGAAEKGL